MQTFLPWDTHAILGYIERRVGREFEPDAANGCLAMLRGRELPLGSAALIDEERAPAF